MRQWAPRTFVGMTSGRPSRSFVACAGRTVDFCKYQGLGNDFILVRTIVRTIKAQGQVIPQPWQILTLTQCRRWTTATKGTLYFRQSKRRGSATATLEWAGMECELLLIYACYCEP